MQCGRIITLSWTRSIENHCRKSMATWTELFSLVAWWQSWRRIDMTFKPQHHTRARGIIPVYTINIPGCACCWLKVFFVFRRNARLIGVRAFEIARSTRFREIHAKQSSNSKLSLIREASLNLWPSHTDVLTYACIQRMYVVHAICGAIPQGGISRFRTH